MLPIYPDSDPLLKKTSRRVRHVNKKLKQLVEDMYETMVENWGIGLAAVQVGVRKRLFIYEIPKRELKGYETCHPDDSPARSDDGALEDQPSEVESESEEQEEVDAGYTGEYTVCINPRIVSREGAFIDEEGCLSKAGWVAKVERSYKITFQAYDIDMKKFERTVTGMEARCVQHEIDHLDGILFTDRALPDTLREIKDGEQETSEEQPSEQAPPLEGTTDLERVEVEDVVRAGEH